MPKLFVTILDVESSDEGVYREGLSDSDDNPLPPYISVNEKYARDLSSKATSRKNVQVRQLDSEERGAFATRHFLKEDFVYDYASTVLSKEDSLADESRYQEQD